MKCNACISRVGRWEHSSKTVQEVQCEWFAWLPENWRKFEPTPATEKYYLHCHIRHEPWIHTTKLPLLNSIYMCKARGLIQWLQSITSNSWRRSCCCENTRSYTHLAVEIKHSQFVRLIKALEFVVEDLQNIYVIYNLIILFDCMSAMPIHEQTLQSPPKEEQITLTQPHRLTKHNCLATVSLPSLSIHDKKMLSSV